MFIRIKQKILLQIFFEFKLYFRGISKTFSDPDDNFWKYSQMG